MKKLISAKIELTGQTKLNIEEVVDILEADNLTLFSLASIIPLTSNQMDFGLKRKTELCQKKWGTDAELISEAREEIKRADDGYKIVYWVKAISSFPHKALCELSSQFPLLCVTAEINSEHIVEYKKGVMTFKDFTPTAYPEKTKLTEIQTVPIEIVLDNQIEKTPF